MQFRVLSLSALGLAVVLAGCAKQSPYSAAVVELKQARIDARKAGLETEPEEYFSRKLPNAQNAAIELSAAAKEWNAIPFLTRSPYAVAWGNILNDKDLTKNQAKVQEGFATAKHVLTLTHAAAKKPDCSFNRDYNTAQVAYPEHDLLKDLAKALSAESIYAAKKGDYATAKTCLVDMQRLAKMISTDKIVNGYVLALNVSKMGLRTAQRVLGEGGVAATGAVEAAAKEVPELHLVDCLPLECLAGVGVLRNINVLDLPGMEEYRDNAAAAQRKDPSLTPGKIARAFESRHLQFWTKVKNQSAGKSNEELGNMMDDLVFAETKLDASHAYNTNAPSYAQVGNALAALPEQQKACLATVALVRGENEAQVLQKYGMKKDATADGFTVYSSTYKVLAAPGKKTSKVSYEFLYPFKGK